MTSLLLPATSERCCLTTVTVPVPMTPEVARIIDANLNRSREALRVMEEYARFALNDPAGCEAIKRLRHELAAVTQGFALDELLAARNTMGDVGTQISTESESARGDARSVFVAAAKRLPEALRAIEEYGKTANRALARQVEAIRYRAYDVEQRILMRGERSARFARVRLYVIITASLCRGDWLSCARAAIRGGAGCLQLREKGMDDGELLKRARLLVELCRDSGVLSIINDRPDLAVLADADGVHVGQTDLALNEARRIVGPDRLIGISTHTTEQLNAALVSEPDYVAVGPMFDSRTKPQSHVPGPSLLTEAVGRTRLPVVPIGGITADHLGAIAAAGGQCVCVCSAVIGAEDVEQAARSLMEGIRRCR